MTEDEQGGDKVLISLRLSKQDAEIVDELIGSADRVVWIENLLAGAVAARKRWGAPCGLGVVAVASKPNGWTGVADAPGEEVGSEAHRAALSEHEGDFQSHGTVGSEHGDE